MLSLLLINFTASSHKLVDSQNQNKGLPFNENLSRLRNVDFTSHFYYSKGAIVSSSNSQDQAIVMKQFLEQKAFFSGTSFSYNASWKRIDDYCTLLLAL